MGMTTVMFLAIVMVGFAHKWQDTPEALDPAIQSYLEAGGSISDICGTGDGSGGAAIPECEACLLKNSFAFLNKQKPTCHHATRWSILPTSFREPGGLSQAFDQSRPSRAPPVA
ncbi:hypothetical protein [Roseovarius rhodophyticola]|uniref:Uncharacterized protein n=1 Tax=Roseovarius rhodophyticola TaxID=3080827 RepID=A0ABZ2TH24_9RHOB